MRRALLLPTLAFLLSFMPLVGSTQAEPPRKAMPSFISGVFRPTAEEIKALKKKLGYPIAQEQIGALADEKNNAALSFLAGQINEFGYEVPPDQAAARKYYAQAAAANSPAAQARMAWYLIAETKNRADAMAMAQKAAEKGNPTAEINLAAMQMLGFAGDDKKEAGFKKLRELAYQEIPEAQFALGAAYLAGDAVPRDNEMALSWLRPAGENGQPEALMALGVCYSQGLGVPVSPELAFSYYLKAAQAGVTEAQHEVGYAYLNGIGTERDYGKSALWLRKSAKKGMVESIANLGGLLATGPEATDESRKEGIVWLQQASDQGHPLAQYFLAALYLNLTGTSPYYNYAAGEALLRNSAEAGNPGAQTDLAQLLRFGTVEGLKADKVEAAKWAYIATQSNYRLAVDLLERIRSTMSEADWADAKIRANAYLRKTAATMRPPKAPEAPAGVDFRY